MKKSLRKVISSVLVAMLFFGWVPGHFSPNVDSATLSGGSLTLGDSRPATSTTYTIDFDNVTTSAIKCIKVAFSDAATGGSKPTGMDITSALLGGTSDYIPTPGSWSVSNNNSTGVSSITYATGETPASASDRTVILTGITNGSSANTTYYAQFSTYDNVNCTDSAVDSGVVAFIYTAGQSVSATVDPTLTFALGSVAAAQPIKSDSSTDTTIETTTSSIPFGTLAANTEKFAAHTLTVSTNAGSGYGVTIRTAGDPPLTSGSNNIDKYTGTYGTPTTWTDPNGTDASDDTGWFGYTTDDSALTQFAGDKFAGPSGTAGDLVASRDVASNNEVNQVAYVIGVNGIQPSGVYTGTVIYVATPTY